LIEFGSLVLEKIFTLLLLSPIGEGQSMGGGKGKKDVNAKLTTNFINILKYKTNHLQCKTKSTDLFAKSTVSDAKPTITDAKPTITDAKPTVIH
jgi:hypothetical protein